MSGPVIPFLASTPSDEGAFYEYLISQGFASRTVANYMRAWRRADAWCRAEGFDVYTASPSLIAAYAATVPESHSMRSHLRTALTHYWELTERRNPPRKAVRVPAKPPPRWRGVEDLEAHRIGQVAARYPGREGTAVLAGAYLGLRATEIASMHWQKFDPDLSWYACTGKGSRTRYLPIEESPLRTRLERVAAGERLGYLFPGSRGRAHVHPTTVLGWVRRLSIEAGVASIHTHQLRHTFVNKVYEESGDLRLAQALAGHSKPETTAGYSRVRPDRLREGMRLVRYGPDDPDDGFDDAA